MSKEYPVRSAPEVTVNHSAILHEQVWVPRRSAPGAHPQGTITRPPPPPPPTRQHQQQHNHGEARYSMLVSTTTTTTPPSPPSSTSRCLWRAAGPLLRLVGQCMYALAMLTIIAGIALCIWGYVGTPIHQFQLIGPLCIGVGVLVYVAGCMLCCREFPAFDKTLRRREKEEKIRQAVDLLGQADIIEWIRADPCLYHELRTKAMKVLKLGNSSTSIHDNGTYKQGTL